MSTLTPIYSGMRRSSNNFENADTRPVQVIYPHSDKHQQIVSWPIFPRPNDFRFDDCPHKNKRPRSLTKIDKGAIRGGTCNSHAMISLQICVNPNRIASFANMSGSSGREAQPSRLILDPKKTDNKDKH